MNLESECEVPAKKSRSKPKVVKDWDEEDILKLIYLVEGLPCLWNAGDDEYHNKIFRDNAWRNISEHFADKYVVADLNAKWTNLRIQFRGYAGRAKTKSGQGALEPPKWRFFNAMSFVGRAEDQQTQPTISNIVLDTESDSNSPSCSTPSLSTPRRPKVSTTQLVTTQIAETMLEAVAAIKERNNNALEPNFSFANYLLSELKALSVDSATAVRQKVTLFFLQCMEEEKAKRF